jgi:hypothetical protein
VVLERLNVAVAAANGVDFDFGQFDRDFFFDLFDHLFDHGATPRKRPRTSGGCANLIRQPPSLARE